MPDWVDYVFMGLITVLMLGGFTFVLIKISKSDAAGLKREDYAELGRLQTKMDHLETSIPNIVEKTMDGAQKQLLKEQIDIQQKLFEQIGDRFAAITKNVNERLDSGFKDTKETFSTVNQQLGSIAKTQQELALVSQDVNNLRRVLEGNQSRGQFGEYTLETIVRSVFGDDVNDVYDFQKSLIHPQGNDVRPDVTIYLPEPDKRLCIDAKFPFASYKELIDGADNATELLKKFKAEMLRHITKIKNDYIVPNETAPYALLFIPSDGIFSYLHSHLATIVEAGRKDNVIIVSPSTLQPMLATISVLKLDYRRAQSIKELNLKIDKLRVQFHSFESDWKTFSNNIRKSLTSIDAIDDRSRRLTRAFEQVRTVSDENGSQDNGDDIAMDDMLP